MTFIDRDTFSDTSATVERLSADAFSKHAIEERRPYVWKVAKPGTWVYGFYVLVAPGALIVYGDLGEAVFRMNARTEDDVIAWVRGSCQGPYYDYPLEKLQNKEAFRKFYVDDAVDRLKRANGPDEANGRYDDLIEEVEGDKDDLSPDVFYRMCWRAGMDCETPGGMNYTARALWIMKAIGAFIRLLDAPKETQS